MTNTRALAAKMVEKVCYHGTSLSEAFLLPDLKPKENDRAFVKEICFGTIRYWIPLTAFLKTLLEKPIKAQDKDIECLLCVGLYQFIYMKLPHYAVVNETVSATRSLKKPWASALINKILRMAIEIAEPLKSLEEKSITARYAHPNWMIDKIKAAWPTDWEMILHANNAKAPLFLRVNKTKIALPDYEKLLSNHKISYQRIEGLSQGIKLNNPLPVDKIPGFKSGLFSVQDASGQKVIEYCDIHSDHRVLDTCAAPGSKTTHILEMHPDIQKLVAVDIAPSRLKKISANMKRLQLQSKNTTLIAADISDVQQWWDGELFDRILVDAPCSASGVIRRHPDIKVLRKKEDIQKLSEQQCIILKLMWPLLKPGGKLIYTTCSIFPDENEQVIAAFLSLYPEAKIIPINNDWGKQLNHGQQVLTGTNNRDGFYYCIVEK